MKKKISKIWGVGLTLMLLASLMVAVVPVGAASLAWSAITLPSVTGNVLVAAGENIIKIAVSPDGGTLIAAAATGKVFRSTNAGLTWTAATTPPGAAVTALTVSPGFGTDKTIYAAATIAGAGRLYKSADGGAIFAQAAADIAGEVITSIALSPNYAVDGLLVVGTTKAGAAAYGNVYILGPAIWGLTAMGLAEDVTAVAFSPLYPSDRTILAVGSVAGAAGTVLHNNVNWTVAVATGWDAVWGAATILTTLKDVGDGAAPIASSSLVLPADYNGMDTTKRVAYVATINAAVNDNVYRVSGATPGVAIAGAGDQERASLAYSGTSTAGTIFGGYNAASGVDRSANPTATTPTWTAATFQPTGGAAPTQVALAPDFATSNKVYAGTQGAESAFSVSTDGGVSFGQSGLIDTVISAITDVTPSPAYATDSTIFLVTSSAGTVESVWKSTNAGTNWTRVYNLATVNDAGIVRLSPAFATDKTVIFAETGAATSAIRKSITGGASWTTIISLVPIADIVVEDTTTFYVASQGTAKVEKNINSVWYWGAGSAGAVALFSLNQAPNGDILVGNTAGGVYRSTDKGITYSTATTIPGIGGGNVVTAFDAAYATNKTIYAASDVAEGTALANGGQIQRFVIGTSTVWAAIDTVATLNPIVGIASPATGILYAADSTAAAYAAGPPVVENGGIRRSLDSTATAPTLEWVSTLDGLTATYTLKSLKVAGNVLFAIEDSAATKKVMSYTDTLTEKVTLSSPKYSKATASALEVIPALTTPTSASLAWTAVTGATSYEVLVNSSSTFGAGTAAVVTYTAPATTATATTLAGTTYYWKVRVNAPVVGAWSDTWKFYSALPAMAAADAPFYPLIGAVNISTTPTFTWPKVVGATGYEFVIGTDPAFAIIDNAANSATNAYVVTEPLLYSTTYYWRVRGVTALEVKVGLPAQGGAWTALVFTTMAKPVPAPEPTPPVIIQPTETITKVEVVEVPSAPVIVPQPIPSYLLWIIIGIGAVLIIALITLIVRTRRVA